MASRSLNYLEAEAYEASSLTDAYARTTSARFVHDAFSFDDNADFLAVPTSEGLKGAKGAMMAIGLEAASVLCAYGIWHLWHVGH
jgi:hypothetical protein